MPVGTGVGGGEAGALEVDADGDALAVGDDFAAAVREAEAVGDAEALGEAECRTVVLVVRTGAAVAEWCGLGCRAGG